MVVWLVEHSSCIYESAYETVAVYSNSRKAYKYMLKIKCDAWQRDRNYGIVDPICFESFRIRKMEVE